MQGCIRMEHDDVPPLFCGRVPVRERVIVRDPLGVSVIDGPGILRAIDYVAGAPRLMHVDFGPHCIARVPPEWIFPDPAAAANVFPFARAAPPRPNRK